MSGARALRADARRNRALVLEAAEVVFAAEGLAVPIDEVARRAGVGVGTVYRHFPTKEALFEAIVVGRVERLVADARAQLAVPDPGGALFRFVHRLVEEGGAKRDLVDALAGAGRDLKGSRPNQELQEAAGELLERAQRAGVVRTDVGVVDVLALVGSVCAVPDATRRGLLVSVLCDGLRPPPGAPARPGPWAVDRSPDPG